MVFLNETLAPQGFLRVKAASLKILTARGFS
jgi:hypothetical protein